MVLKYLSEVEDNQEHTIEHSSNAQQIELTVRDRRLNENDKTTNNPT